MIGALVRKKLFPVGFVIELRYRRAAFTAILGPEGDFEFLGVPTFVEVEGNYGGRSHQ